MKTYNSGPKVGMNFVFEDTFKYVKPEGGIVDKNNIKTCFIKLGTYVRHNESEENRTQDLKHLHFLVRRGITRVINKDLIQPSFISTPIIHDSFTETGRAFTQFDYTFFVLPGVTFHQLNDEMINIIRKIDEEVLEKQNLFDIIKDQTQFKDKYGKGKKYLRSQDLLREKKERSSKEIFQ
jgi:hypothetical protein